MVTVCPPTPKGKGLHSYVDAYGKCHGTWIQGAGGGWCQLLPRHSIVAMVPWPPTTKGGFWPREWRCEGHGPAEGASVLGKALGLPEGRLEALLGELGLEVRRAYPW